MPISEASSGHEHEVIEGEVVDEPTHPAAEKISLRRPLLVLGVLLVQMAFIGALAGAWHSPTPHGLPVALVTSPGVEQFQARVEQNSDAINTHTFTQRDAAFAALNDQEVYAVLVAGAGGQLELHVASAAGSSATETLAQLYGKFALSTGMPLQVYDDVVLPASDSRGLTPFALVVGWVIGGYLLPLVAGRRLLALLAAAALSAIGGVLVVGPLLGIWHDHLVTLAAVGVLVVFGAAATSAVFGTAVAMVVLLALGIPAAGGLFVPELLPEPFRSLHGWLLPAAGATAVRSVVYFGGRGGTAAYLVLLAWAVFGSLLCALATSRVSLLDRSGPGRAFRS